MFGFVLHYYSSIKYCSLRVWLRCCINYHFSISIFVSLIMAAVTGGKTLLNGIWTRHESIKCTPGAFVIFENIYIGNQFEECFQCKNQGRATYKTENIVPEKFDSKVRLCLICWWMKSICKKYVYHYFPEFLFLQFLPFKMAATVAENRHFFWTFLCSLVYLGIKIFLGAIS
jgi:hypothetical protein